MDLWLVQPEPWGSGDGVDGLVIRAESPQAATRMASEYAGGSNWAATQLSAKGDAEILFGAERACWELN